jgi:membrane-associated phospholipid phosphatase
MGKRISICLLLLLPCCIYSQNIDIQLLRSINSPESLTCDDFFRFTSNSEVYVAVGIPAGMAVAALIRDDKNMLRNAAVMLAGEALSTGLELALKYTINRDRPFVTYSDITKKISAGGPSFPSGHTSNAFATATSLSLAYPKWYVIVPSFAWAGTVGYSRMHLGVHYPSDVLAGAVVGAGSAYLTFKINQKLNQKQYLRKRHKACDCPE